MTDRSKQWRRENPERVKAYRKKYKSSEKGKATNNKYAKKFRESEKGREYIKDYYNSNKEKFKHKDGYMKKYIKEYFKDEENKKKYLIRQRDNSRLRRGKIKKNSECLFCESNNNLEMHHKNYKEEGKIITLCKKCHGELHRKINLELNQQGGQ